VGFRGYRNLVRDAVGGVRIRERLREGSVIRNVQRFRGGLVFEAQRLCEKAHLVVRPCLAERLDVLPGGIVQRESCGSEAGSYLRLIDFVYHSCFRLIDLCITQL